MQAPDEPVTPAVQAPVDAPNGMYEASVDRKGRVKLPVVLQRYLRGLGEPPLFVTSLDRKVGHLYLASVWRQKRLALSSPGPDARRANHILFNAADLGEDTVLDGEGRVLLPTNMRRALGLEDSQVRLYVNRERIEILSNAVYEARRQEAAENSDEDLAELENKGYL